MPEHAGWHRVPSDRRPPPAWLRGATFVAYLLGAVALASLAFGWLVVAALPAARDIITIARPAVVVVAFVAAVIPVLLQAPRIGAGDFRFAHPLAAWVVGATLLLAVPWRQVEAGARWTLNASAYEHTALRVVSGEIHTDGDGTAWLAGPTGALSSGGRVLVRRGFRRLGVFFYLVDPVTEEAEGFLYLSDLRGPAADVLHGIKRAHPLRPHWYYVQFVRDANPPLKPETASPRAASGRQHRAGGERTDVVATDARLG